MSTSYVQQELPMNLGIKPKRMLRLELTPEQIKLLADYAVHSGYKTKLKNGNMDTTELNLAAKYAIMSRLGFN